MKYITKAKLEGLSFEINLTSIINTGITKFFGVGGGVGIYLENGRAQTRKCSNFYNITL